MTYEDCEYGMLPVTAEEWRPYLAEYSAWYLSDSVNREHVWGHLSEEQRQAEYTRPAPASAPPLPRAAPRSSTCVNCGRGTRNKLWSGRDK